LGEELCNGLQGALPTLPLNNFTGLLTAFSNDCNALHMFAQLVWGLGRKQDVLLAITTSGNSPNILHAVTVAKAKGLKIIALTGQTGGKIKDEADVAICAPATWTPDIQEYHLPIYHALCLMLEDAFF
jgi:D-sedoheptulose 7-phosphate isomerase